jgi:hypothetical protein
MTTHMAATLMAVMMRILIVIMGKGLATSALAAVGMTIIIIPVTASFCSTPSDAGIRCASNIAVIGVNSVITGIVKTMAMIWAVTAMKVLSEVIGTAHGPRDQRRRIVKEAGCATLTTIGAMVGGAVGEMAMTNGAAVMVAEPVLFRYQIQARRKAGVEGRIMVAPMRSPTGGATGRQTGIMFPRHRGKFHRYGRMLRPLNNRPNPAPSRKVRKRRVSVYLKAA